MTKDKRDEMHCEIVEKKLDKLIEIKNNIEYRKIIKPVIAEENKWLLEFKELDCIGISEVDAYQLRHMQWIL